MPRETLSQPNCLLRFIAKTGSMLIAALVVILPAQPVLGGDHPACVAGAGFCLNAQSGPGCDPVDCCNLVCDIDPVCCESIWDDACADHAQGMCDADALCPGQEDCYTEHSTPGCSNDLCCADVCNDDDTLYCCQTGWTPECVDLAFDLCPCGAPGAEGCSFPHESDGCDDQPCCELLCGLDSFCCYSAWDDICVAQASLFCGTQPCTLQCPVGAVHEPESCGALLNEACNGPPGGDPDALSTPIPCGVTLCGTAFAQFTRDTDWYRITVTEPTQLTWTVAAEFPAAAIIVAGTCNDGFGALNEAFTSDCTAASAEHCVGPGTYFLFVAPATPERTLRSGAACPECHADLSQNGVVNALDLALLLGAWGSNPGHPADFTLDGLINISDLSYLLDHWGPCPLPPGSLWGTDYIASLACEPC